LIPRPARYLLRIDDLCPTVCRERWQRWRALIEEFQIRPILAVVPDNQDPELQLSPPDEEFWSAMRAMESTGATIGLHGYRHLCASHGRGFLTLHRATEFAGVAEEAQREWIGNGLHLLRGYGLNPKIWVAPRHGFDRNTLLALRPAGIQLLSDGFARVPFLRDGLVWIPQQLWAPVDKQAGLWTICIHPNTASDAQLAELSTFLRGHARQFTSVEEVVAELPLDRLNAAERVYEQMMLFRIQAAYAKKRLWSRWQKRGESQAVCPAEE
jgi:predicted deacetylase